MSWLTNLFKPEPHHCPVCNAEVEHKEVSEHYVVVPDDKTQLTASETCGNCGDWYGEHINQLDQIAEL